jgi:hypothetical protein
VLAGDELRQIERYIIEEIALKITSRKHLADVVIVSV